MPKKAKYYVRPDGLHETIRTINGKRVAFRGKSDREVDRKMLEYTERQSGKIKFSEVAEAWWEYIEGEVDYNTFRGYKAAYNSAIMHFGDKNVADIIPADVQQYIDAMAMQQYSKKTMTTYLQIVRQILGYAIAKNYIKFNAATAAEVKHGAPRQYRKPSTEEEAQIIRDHYKEPEALLLVLVYCTGLRRSEAFALRYEDIDWEQNMIHVRRSCYYVGAQPYEKDPKTEKGTRDIPLLKMLAEALPKDRKHGYIFSPDGGKSMMNRSPVMRYIANTQKRYGITSTLHQIRHAYASALEEAELSRKTRQTFLGHAQSSTTDDIYTHIRNKTVLVATEKMENVF